MNCCLPSLLTPPSSWASLAMTCMVLLLLVVAMEVLVVNAMVEAVWQLFLLTVLSVVKLTCILATESRGIAFTASYQVQVDLFTFILATFYTDVS